MIFLYTWWFLLKGNVGYWPSKLDMLFCRTPCIVWIEENSIEATVTIFLLIFIRVNAVNLMRYWNIGMIKSCVKQIQMEISAGFLLMPWFICRNASCFFMLFLFIRGLKYYSDIKLWLYWFFLFILCFTWDSLHVSWIATLIYGFQEKEAQKD